MAEPISLDEAKQHLRVDSDADDDLIADYIVAAREWVERETGLILVKRPISERFTGFGERMRLRAWPVDHGQPVTIAYFDRAGAAQSITTASLRVAARPAGVAPAAGTRWPSAFAVDGEVTVSFTAGYAAPVDVPQLLKQAMLALIASLYDDRGGASFASAETSARSLCRSFRRRVL